MIQIFTAVLVLALGYLIFDVNRYQREEDSRMFKKWHNSCVETIAGAKGIVDDANVDGVVVVFDTGVREKYPETSLEKVSCD